MTTAERTICIRVLRENEAQLVKLQQERPLTTEEENWLEMVRRTLGRVEGGA